MLYTHLGSRGVGPRLSPSAFYGLPSTSGAQSGPLPGSSRPKSRNSRQRRSCIRQLKTTCKVRLPEGGYASMPVSENTERFKAVLNSFLVMLRKVFITAAFFAVANRVLHGQGMSTLALLGIQLVLPLLFFKKVLRLSGSEALAASLASIPAFWGALARFVPPQHMVCTTVQLSTRIMVPTAVFQAVTAPNPVSQAAALLCRPFQGSGLAKWFYLLTWMITSAFCYTSFRLGTLHPSKWSKVTSSAHKKEGSSAPSVKRPKQRSDIKHEREHGLPRAEALSNYPNMLPLGIRDAESAPVKPKAVRAESVPDWLHIIPSDTGYVPPPSTFHVYETQSLGKGTETSNRSTTSSSDDWDTTEPIEGQLDADDGPQLPVSSPTLQAREVPVNEVTTDSGVDSLKRLPGVEQGPFSTLGDARPPWPAQNTSVSTATQEDEQKVFDETGSLSPEEGGWPKQQASAESDRIQKELEELKLKCSALESERQGLRDLQSAVERLRSEQKMTARELLKVSTLGLPGSQQAMTADDIKTICADIVSVAIKDASQSHGKLHLDQEIWNEAMESNIVVLTELAEKQKADSQLAESAVKTAVLKEMKGMLERELEKCRVEIESTATVNQVTASRISGLLERIESVEQEAGAFHLRLENLEVATTLEDKILHSRIDHEARDQPNAVQRRVKILLAIEKQKEAWRDQVDLNDMVEGRLTALEGKLVVPDLFNADRKPEEEPQADNKEQASQDSGKQPGTTGLASLSWGALPLSAPSLESTVSQSQIEDPPLSPKPTLPVQDTSAADMAQDTLPEPQQSLEGSVTGNSVSESVVQSKDCITSYVSPVNEEIRGATSKPMLADDEDLGEISQRLYGPWGPVQKISRKDADAANEKKDPSLASEASFTADQYPPILESEAAVEMGAVKEPDEEINILIDFMLQSDEMPISAVNSVPESKDGIREVAGPRAEGEYLVGFIGGGEEEEPSAAEVKVIIEDVTGTQQEKDLSAVTPETSSQIKSTVEDPSSNLEAAKKVIEAPGIPNSEKALFKSDLKLGTGSTNGNGEVPVEIQFLDEEDKKSEASGSEEHGGESGYEDDDDSESDDRRNPPGLPKTGP